MGDIRIKQIIDGLSEALVFAEPADLQALAVLHGGFEDAVKWAEKQNRPEVAVVLTASVKLLEKMIFGEVPDSKSSFEVISRTISALQNVLCEGGDFDPAQFPADLGLESNQVSDTAPAAPKPKSKKRSTKKSQPEPQTPTPDVPKAPEKSVPKQLEGDLGLLRDFVSEAMEHLDASDAHLLTLETDPNDCEALNAVFRAFHTIKGVAGFLSLEDIGLLAHEAENLLDRARKNELELAGAAIDVTFEAIDTMKLMVEDVRKALSTGEPLTCRENLTCLVDNIKAVASGKDVEDTLSTGLPYAGPGMRVGEILVENGRVREVAVDRALEIQSNSGGTAKIGEILVAQGEVEAKDAAHALRAQKAQAGGVQVREPVKVDADKLDRLVDTIGELVIAETMVSQADELKGVSARLSRQMSHLGKITRELQEMGTSLSMVPVRATFQKMARVVRDLAKKSGKQIEFIMSGEDTELDKTVVDKMGDPLVHMVRNSVDHGIETPEERLRAGKPASGTIHLKAFHKGGSIYVEIEDDGKGLDRDAITAKAIEKGLIGEGDILTDRDIFGLILLPGFSTALKVTEVSGRGVGMDVVKKSIDSLRGQIEIRSNPGQGSAVSIRLPLTLAIIDGMVVRVGAERYIIPTLSVLRSIRPEPGNISTVFEKGTMLSIQDKLIPLYSLGELFKVDGALDDPTQALVVIVEDDGRQAGLVTDELVGQQQIVIKSLGETMRDLQGVSGGAIMADGRVGLILDVGGLVQLAHGEAVCTT